MTTITVKIPKDKERDVSNYVKNIGGKVLNAKKEIVSDEDDEEVTHGVFFGENINRIIKAFKKH